MFLTTDVHRRRSLTFALVAMAWAAVAAEPTISVEARQRYPWNGLVDLNFTITGTSGTKYDTSFTAKDMGGNTNITMATIRKADGSAANVAKEQLLPGTYNWVWDAAADLPKDFQCDRVTVTGIVTGQDPLYMIVDLNSGEVSYLSAAPAGGWGSTYKENKMAFRRIRAGSFREADTRLVTLTKDFWMGVFEVTAKQFSAVGCTVPYGYYYASEGFHPVGHVSYNTIRGSTNGAKWPQSDSVDSSSFMGRLRSRTGLKFDLPTEAQWEYACRAGTTTKYNYGSDGTDNLSSYCRYGCYEEYPGIDYTLIVGSKLPNGWGLYDMHGNAKEWCLDWYGGLASSAVTDPKGPTSGTKRVVRGGGCFSSATECSSIYRSSNAPANGCYYDPDYTYDVSEGGFRCALLIQ